MRIAFATTTAEVLHDDDDLDRELHERSFVEAGIELEYRVWWDGDVVWPDYDLVVIRSTWDYVERLGQFRDWLQRVDRYGRLRNPAPIVDWNLDKRYLLELHREGLPVIPTKIASTESEIGDALSAIGGEVVVKPVVSAGSRDTGRFAGDSPQAAALAGKIVGRGGTVMVQPCVASVGTTGEVGTVLFNGEVSHSFRKSAILSPGGGFIAGTYAEEVTPVSLTDQQREVVETTAEMIAAVAAARFDVRAPLLYARIDLVTLDDGRDVVLEVELAEPSFFLTVDPGAARRFVDAVTQHMRR